MRNRRNLFVVLVVAVSAAALLFGVTQISRTDQSDEKVIVDRPKNIQQTYEIPLVGAELDDVGQAGVDRVLGTKIIPGSIYTIDLDDGSRYYGQIQDINDAYYRMSPVYYIEGGQLITLGNEVHGPESAMHIRKASTEKFSNFGTGQVYAELSKKIDLPIDPQDPSGPINSQIRSGGFQAVFTEDGSAYFGSLVSIDGEIIFEGTVYSLFPPAKLEPVDASLLSINDVLFWENLKPNTPVSAALTELNR